MTSILIVGTGLAGYTVAREWRKLNKDAALQLITTDDGCFYSKPMLSNAYQSRKTPDNLAVNTAQHMAEQLNARIHTHVTVDTIDTAAHTVGYHGNTIAYRKLVLALGADPIRIPLEGDAADSVLSINDLADYTRFRAAATPGARILIMGAGLIGCEFANDLCGAGYNVHVVDPASAPLSRLLPPMAATALHTALAALGVRWHLRTSVKSVNHGPHAYRAMLADGTIIEADLVMSAIGLRPRTGLAAQGGIKIHRGIVTDRQLKTSNDDIYALGDCAEVGGLVLPFIMPIMHAARALAKTLHAEPTAVIYPPMPIVVKIPALPVVIAPPPMDAAGAWQETVNSLDVRSLFVGPDQTLLGYALTGAATKEKNVLTQQLPPVLA